MPEHSLKIMLCSRGKSTQMCFYWRSSFCWHIVQGMLGAETRQSWLQIWQLLLAIEVSKKTRQLLSVPSHPVPPLPLHEKKYHFLPFLPFNAVSEPGCKSTVKPSAAEPNVIVSSSMGLIPFNISHSSTGSSNTVSLCLGMHSGLPRSLYVACWKWASAQNPALPWLSAPPHNTHIPLVHRRASPLPSITYRQKLSPTELLPWAELPPRGIPRDLINPNFSDKTFEVLIHRCDKQPASLWTKPADKAQLQSNKNHPDSQATGKGFCLRLP